MVHPVALSATHMECRNLHDSMTVMTELLAFQPVSEKKPAEAMLKHPNSPWVLVLHEAGPDAPAKPMHNHWGVRVRSTEEVDNAYHYLTGHKQQYKLGAIGKPTWSHGSYSCYFVEPGTNGWEIECYEDFARKENLAALKSPIGKRFIPKSAFRDAGTCRRLLPMELWWRRIWMRTGISTPMF
jgi:hypothetical protein